LRYECRACGSKFVKGFQWGGVRCPSCNSRLKDLWILGSNAEVVKHLLVAWLCGLGLGVGFVLACYIGYLATASSHFLLWALGAALAVGGTIVFGIPLSVWETLRRRKP